MKIKNGKLQIKNYNFQYRVLQLIIMVLVIITIYSFTTLGLTAKEHNPIFDSHYYKIGQMLGGFLEFDIDLKNIQFKCLNHFFNIWSSILIYSFWFDYRGNISTILS